MVQEIISLLFIALGASCNAVMDICAHHFEISIFRKRNAQYWNANISWKNKYINPDYGDYRRKKFLGINVHVAFTDAWHLFKSMMIVFIALSILTFPGMELNLLNILIELIKIGLTWNIIFVFLYQHILRT